MTEVQPHAPVREDSAAKAWLRAIERTSPIARNRDRIFPRVIEELAARLGDTPALLSDRECLSYRRLAERANQYARWALEQGVAKGDVVGLLMPNRPEYLAIWLGITSVGGVVALLNTSLAGPSLAHCIDIAAPKHLIVAAESIFGAIDLAVTPEIWIHGSCVASYSRIDLEIERHDRAPLSKAEQRPVSIEDRALYIYTSGTTGLPKAASVSHARVMQWSHWFSGMMDVQPADRMYNCLPMYHSVGGVLAPGAILVGGGSVVIREKFSASQFWSDLVRWDCTLVQYIGELCRYLLHAPPSPDEPWHRIRMACGNGLSPDVWERFQSRFRIPRIFEFYAATEGGVSLFNIEGKPGAIGRVPQYLAHRFSPALIRVDTETGDPVRNEAGYCIRCGPNEPGEALGRALDDPSTIGTRFEGYTSTEATAKKTLRNVFETGDAWIRTGDLMRKDEKGFFHFVDRLGDTFRWKGENVAASEVAEAICAFPGIKQASVYGVAVQGADGRAGMAAVTIGDAFDLRRLREHLSTRLPAYARPLFLRLKTQMDVTGTFKYSKPELVREGYNPEIIADVIYFNDPARETFVRLDKHLYDRIQNGEVRL